MHSARPTGWSGEIVPPSGAAPLGAPSHSAEPDPLVDTNATGGLSKFDLGMVPASVTPPRTWRHAAWFAVMSSAATLGGLVFATSALVGNTSSPQHIDLPSMPRAGEYPALPSQDDARTTRPDAPQGVRRDSANTGGDTASPAGRLPGGSGPGAGRAPSDGPGRDAPAAPAPPAPGGGDEQQDDGWLGIGDDSDDGADDATRPPSESTPPPSSTPPSSEPPRELAALVEVPDREKLRQRTADYFSAVASGDLRAAYGMTAGDLRAEGFGAFAARYAEAASIEVVDSTVNWDTTFTTLRITRENGTELTQRRRLEFTSGDDPRIEADELVS